MKRLVMAAVALLLGLGLVAPAFADGNDTPPQGWSYGQAWGMGPGMMGYGPRGGWGHMGPGMMGYGGGWGHMGPGMMGYGGGWGHMGPGMMGGGWGMGPVWMHPALAQLPQEKQDQLQKLHYSMMQAMITKRAEVQSKQLELAEVLRTFPLDQKAAQSKWEALSKARQEMFALRVSAMAQVQQIVGKELWEQMHSGFPGGGRPYGRGPGRGPGMMGPQAPR